MLQAQALEFVVTGILGNGSERGKKKRPKDSGIGDGVGLHCGRDHGTQALPQEESNQLSNAALVSCVCVCVCYTLTLEWAARSIDT